MPKTLIVDGDQRQRGLVEDMLTERGHRVSSLGLARAALAEARREPVTLVILDLELADADGLATLSEFTRLLQPPQIIVTTSHPSTARAIEATKLGAFDYLPKPYDMEFLYNLVQQALKAARMMRDSGQAASRPNGGEALVGGSRAMQEVYKAIGRVAPTESTVLIRGESGTGKELVARAVYRHSGRGSSPFVVVNCVAIPETLLESELFGYEKGAFTGAGARKVGKIEMANGGTVFLDEIGDMPLAIQAKMLRLLQEKSIERLGGRTPIEVDVRIIAATNRDLEEAIEQGRFRQDLFYRLNVVPILLPPLRQRPDDVGDLAEFFLSRLSQDLGVRNPGVTEDAVDLLQQCDWPGNVRELGNALEKCLIFSRGAPIDREAVASLVVGGDLPDQKASGAPDLALKEWALRELASGGQAVLKRMGEHVDQVIIREALFLTQGNRTKAAALLGVSRPNLLAKMAKLGLKEQFPSD